MRKKLCLTCAQALQKRADIRYTGKRTRMDMCSGCHSKMLVTEYIVPDEPVPITPKPEPKSAAVQYKLGEKLTMTVAVDNRTAGAILRYAERWAIEPGAVIDSLMRFYKRAMKERYNHGQL